MAASALPAQGLWAPGGERPGSLVFLEGRGQARGLGGWSRLGGLPAGGAVLGSALATLLRRPPSQSPPLSPAATAFENRKGNRHVSAAPRLTPAGEAGASRRGQRGPCASGPATSAPGALVWEAAQRRARHAAPLPREAEVARHGQEIDFRRPRRGQAHPTLTGTTPSLRRSRPVTPGVARPSAQRRGCQSKAATDRSPRIASRAPRADGSRSLGRTSRR